MDKTFLLQQLAVKLRAIVDQAQKTADESRGEAKTGASRAVNLHKGVSLRCDSARASLDALDGFRPKPHAKGQPIGLGALVEVESETGGKTLFLAPAGAGEELTGPDGDGIFQVVTPVSPIGRAILGKRVGDDIEVNLQGETIDWTITYAA